MSDYASKEAGVADERFDAKEEAEKLVEIVEALSKTGAPPSDLLATARVLVAEERFDRQRKEYERGMVQRGVVGPPEMGISHEALFRQGGLR